jgi:hypothetical protein
MDQKINEKVSIQKDYINAMKESITLMGSVYGDVGKRGAADLKGSGAIDPELNKHLQDTKDKQTVIDYYANKASLPGVTPDKQKLYQDLKKEAEADLSKSVQETAGYVANSGIDVSAGSDGRIALQEVSNSMGKISNADVLTNLKNNLTEMTSKTGNAEFKTIMTNVIKRR